MATDLTAALLAAGPSSYMTGVPSTEATKARRKIAEALMMQGMDASPVQHWTQGAARVANAIMGGYEHYKADKEDRTREEETVKSLSSLPGLSPASVSAVPTDTSQPRGIRNNNPLNIEAGKFTASQGMTGSDGRFAQFPNMDQGVTAADNLLRVYANKHGLNTINGIVSRWAPAGDGNNVSAYASNVAKQLGVDPNSPLDMNNPQVRRALIGAMAQHENGRPVQVASLDPSAGAARTNPQTVPQAQVAQSNPIDPQMGGYIKALLSNPSTRQYGMQLYSSLLQKQQYGFQTLPDGTIIRTDPRRGTVEPIYQAQTKPSWGVIGEDQFGNKRYGWIDPVKRSVEAIPGSPQSSGAVTVTGPDGKQLEVPAGQDPKKFREAVTSATADAMVGKTTEAQGNAILYANRMEDAQSKINQHESAAQGLKDNIARGASDGRFSPIPRGATNWAVSNEYQKLEQAKSQFITAMLRKESGAVINKDEFQRYDREYFPQLGDSAQVIEQKRKARDVAIAAMKQVAGPAYKRVKTNSAPETASNENDPLGIR